jgi:dTDP-4-amino-4,6-dideoxygalactose transaminase
MQHLQDCGISTRRGIMNAHQEPVYAMQKWQLPKSECARDCALLLPLYHELTEQDIACITNALLQAGQR